MELYAINVKLNENDMKQLKGIMAAMELNQSDALRFCVQKGFESLGPTDEKLDPLLQEYLEKILAAVKYNILETVKLHQGKTLDQIGEVGKANILHHFQKIMNKLHPAENE